MFDARQILNADLERFFGRGEKVRAEVSYCSPANAYPEHFDDAREYEAMYFREKQAQYRRKKKSR